MEWANVKYEATPDLNIRIGRIVLPSFMISDYRKVGYATPWLRTPVEVYSLVPLTQGDGADASYRMHLGEFKNTIQVYYGESSTHLVEGGKVKGTNARGITDTLERGPATLRFSYLKSDFELDSPGLNTLFNGFRQFGAQGAAIADKYDFNNKDFTFFSAGYRFDKLTPYVTYARASMKSSTYEPGLNVPPGHPAAALNAELNTILARAPQQKTISLGVRWDFAKDAAFKVQFDHSDVGRGSPGTLSNMQSGFVPGGKYNVFSVALDFVF